MYKRILLALDGSELAEQALPHALAQAERFQAELVLLRVFVPVAEPPGMWSPAVKQALERSRVLAYEYLEPVAARLQGRGISVQTVTTEGRPHAEIIHYVEENQVDLIVMSTRGESGLSRWLMGSVADRVARGARVPVLLVPATTEEM
jgi:nucleotide-binding universal stress UspA family protein